MKLLKIFIILLFFVSISCQDKQNTTEPEVTNPDKPNSPTPANGATGTELDISLSWKCNNADEYDIYLDTNNPPTTLLASNSTSKSIKCTGLSHKTTYYWKIIAKSSDESTTEGDIWNFTTKEKVSAPAGYKLYKHHIETQLPAFVNIMFQVTDLDENGVDNLVTENFEVLEDNQTVSPTESAMHVRKKDQIPYTLKTVLLLDNSASVGANLEEIKNSAKALVQNIATQQFIAIYKFSEDPVLIQDFTDDVSALTNAINSISLGYATTDLYGSIIEGVSRWEDLYSTNEVQQGFLVALTDGSDTQGSYTLSEALQARGNKKVYTVGLGDEIDPSVLQQLGNAGFFNITDVNDLATKFTEIQSDMAQYANSFYWLNYMSPKRGDNTHTLKLYVKDNVNSGSDSYITGEFNSSGFYSVYSGLYINPSNSNPYGIDTLTISEDDTISINAVTYLGNNPPAYQWSSGDESLILAEPNLTDPSIASVISLGDSGQTTTITVEDVANGLSKTIDVVITKSTIPTDGLVAYYPFNGNANDESGNEYHGSVLGNATVNTILTIGNNSSDRVSLPYELIDGLTDFSFSACVKLNSVHTSGQWPSNCLISGARNYTDNIFNIEYTASNSGWHIIIEEQSYEFDSNTIIEGLTWHHILIIRNSNLFLLYIDGTQIGSSISVTSNSIDIDSGGLFLGQDQDVLGGSFAANQSWAGDIDNFRIYNRALNDDEIQQVYNHDKK